MDSKILKSIFYKTADHIYGDLVQFDPEFGLFEDFEHVEYLVFGNKPDRGKQVSRITIDFSGSDEKIFVLEGKDIAMIKGIIALNSDKKFKSLFKSWFLKKFPHLKDYNYEFIVTFEFPF